MGGEITKGDILFLILDYKKCLESTELKKELAGFYRRALKYDPKNLEMEESLQEYSASGFIEKTEKECEGDRKRYYELTKSGKKVLGRRILEIVKDDKNYNLLENIIYALGN